MEQNPRHAHQEANSSQEGNAKRPTWSDTLFDLTSEDEKEYVEEHEHRHRSTIRGRSASTRRESMTKNRELKYNGPFSARSSSQRPSNAHERPSKLIGLQLSREKYRKRGSTPKSIKLGDSDSKILERDSQTPSARKTSTARSSYQRNRGTAVSFKKLQSPSRDERFSKTRSKPFSIIKAFGVPNLLLEKFNDDFDDELMSKELIYNATSLSDFESFKAKNCRCKQVSCLKCRLNNVTERVESGQLIFTGDVDKQELFVSETNITKEKSTFVLNLYEFVLNDDAVVRFDLHSGYQICWSFLKYKNEINLNTRNDNLCNISKAHKYKFDMDRACYQYFSRCPLRFFIYTRDIKRIIAHGALNCEDGLIKPGTLIRKAVKITNNELCYLMPKEFVKTQYGTLKCSIKFIVKKELIPNFIKPKTEISKLPALKIPPSMTLFNKKQMNEELKILDKCVSESEVQKFQNGLNLVLIRNSALKTTQEEINSELEDRRAWMHEELKWRLTLQEHNLLSGLNPMDIEWRQWKDDASWYVKHRRKSTDHIFSLTKPTLLVIKIQSVTFSPSSRVTNDPTITQIYVEFSFLNFNGPALETYSERKPLTPQPIKFEFKKEFSFSSDNAFRALSTFIKNKENIAFSVISEPLPELKGCQTCEELGIAKAQLFQVLQSLEDQVTLNLAIMDVNAPDDSLGDLTILFSGVSIVRSSILYFLSHE